MPVRLLLAGVLFLAFLSAVRTYVVEIYPRTTQALGDAFFFMVMLIPDKDKAEILAQSMHMELGYKPRWVWLLDQSDENYFLAVPPLDCDGYDNVHDVHVSRLRSVVIRKSLVEGIRKYHSGFDYPARCE